MKDITIGIIGCGNMGGAIARGMVAKDLIDKGKIFLYDKDAEKSESLVSKTGCSLGDLSQMVRGSDILLIAVKPQDSEELFRRIAGDIVDQTVISVMAGVTINAITGKIGKKAPIVRAMPNMAALVGESITCISSNDLVKNNEEVNKIFTSIGKVLEVDENVMDAVTALSGGGPAYLYCLAEAMIEAGIETGLDEGIAKELVMQTLYGSSLFMKESGKTPEELIEGVASKGGTTEVALSHFIEKEFKTIIKTAITRAKGRSEELSQGD